MNIQNAPLTFPVSTNSPLSNRQAWQVGQILQAIVQGPKQPGFLEIRIGEQTLSAKTEIKLPPGHILNLRVVENGQQLVFKQISNTLENNSARLEQLLRQNLPKQQPLPALLTQLRKLAAGTINASNTGSALLQKQLTLVQNIGAELNSLSNPQALKQAIRNSGIFLEAKLASLLPETANIAARSSVNELNTDLKGALLKLLTLVDQTLKTTEGTSTTQTFADARANSNKALVQHASKDPNQAIPEQRLVDLKAIKILTESAISTIQLNQSQSLLSSELANLLWVIDLPLSEDKHPQTLKLEIQSEDKQADDDKTERKWQLNLTIDIAPLGQIDVQLVLSGQTLSSSIWAQQAPTNALIKHYLPRLESGLQESGLQVSGIHQHPLNRQQANINAHRLPLVRTKI